MERLDFLLVRETEDAREAMRLASHKLSVLTKFVKRFEAEVSA